MGQAPDRRRYTGQGEPLVTLQAGMELIVPPVTLHHLVLTGPVEVTLAFYREVPTG